MFLSKRAKYRSWGGSTDRWHWQFDVGRSRMAVELRSKLEPHTLSREEMYSMRKLLRDNEVRMGWRIPEPDMDPPILAEEVLEMQVLGIMATLDNGRLNTLAQFARSLHERKV